MSTLTIPNSIDVGTPLDATEVQANNNAISSWANGNIDDDNHSSGYKVVPLMNTERRIFDVYTYDQASTTSGTTYALVPFGAIGTVVSGTSGNLNTRFYWDTANYSITGRTTYWRVAATFDTNSTAPNVAYTVGLHASTGLAATASIPAGTFNATATASTTVASGTMNSANTNYGSSATLSAPATAFYFMGVTVSGTPTAGSRVAIRATVSVYHV